MPLTSRIAKELALTGAGNIKDEHHMLRVICTCLTAIALSVFHESRVMPQVERRLQSTGLYLLAHVVYKELGELAAVGEQQCALKGGHHDSPGSLQLPLLTPPHQVLKCLLHQTIQSISCLINWAPGSMADKA